MVAQFYAAPPFSGAQKGMTLTPFAPAHPPLTNDLSLTAALIPFKMLYNNWLML